MTEEWVCQHNIIAVHEKDWNQYKLKTFRLRMNGSTIDAVVYDMCSDSDCDAPRLTPWFMTCAPTAIAMDAALKMLAKLDSSSTSKSTPANDLMAMAMV